MQSKPQLITNFLDRFTIYTDPKRVHPLIGNDILNLTDHNNELDLYIQVDDMIDGYDIYQRILNLYGPIFLDVGRFYKTTEGTEFFRDFTLVEKIDVKVHFDTKPVLLNVLGVMKDLFLVQTVIFWKYFNLGINEWDNITIQAQKLKIDEIAAFPAIGLKTAKTKGITKGELGKDKKPIPIVSSKVYKKNILNFAPLPEGFPKEFDLFHYTKVPKAYFIEWFFKPNNPVKKILKNKKLLKLAFNRILYYDGMLGYSDFSLLGNIRPTLYDYLDTFADPENTKVNSSYYFGQVKHELFIRWDLMFGTSGINYAPINFNAQVAEKFGGSFTYYTRLYGLGLVDTEENYNYLKGTFSSKDIVGGGGTYLMLAKEVSTKENKLFNLGTIMNSACHSDGTVYTELGKKIAFEQGSGLEAPLCASYKTFMREFDLRDTFLFKAFPIETGYKSFTIAEHIPHQYSIKTENVTEFYDREHNSPFDDISTYTAIPLTFSNYTCSEAYLFNYLLEGLKPEIAKGMKQKICFDSGIRVHKKKYVEDDNGNVSIKDIGNVTLSSGEFKIPFNKNEYAYAIYVDNSIKTWYSKDMFLHIKIKFKKAPQYKQNFVLRLFHNDTTFATEQLIKRNTNA